MCILANGRPRIKPLMTKKSSTPRFTGQLGHPRTTYRGWDDTVVAQPFMNMEEQDPADSNEAQAINLRNKAAAAGDTA
jgi:hypothetical protein